MKGRLTAWELDESQGTLVTVYDSLAAMAAVEKIFGNLKNTLWPRDLNF